MRCLLSVVTALFVFVASSQIVNAASATYSITDLGSFGSAETWANGINEPGQVVGHSGGDAFFYTKKEMTDLAPFTISFSSSAAINNRGQIAGITSVNGVIEPAIYQKHGQVTVLPSLGAVGAGGAQTAQAEAINNRGQVVGSAYVPGSPYQHAVLWSDGRITDLGALGAYSYASSLNDSGEIVGTTASGKSPTGDWLQVPFLYANGAMIDLGQLGLDYALDINNKGQIVGSMLVGSGSELRLQAALLDHGTVFNIHILGLQSAALALNERGQIVGYFQFQSGTQSHCDPSTGQCTEHPVYADHPFLYDDQGVMTDLNALLPSDSGWELQYATDINNRGQIVGWGLHDGNTRAFVLTPHGR